MLEFRNVSFSYGTEQLINDVSFQIQTGDFVALVGENGAGKTTLSKLCNGLLKPNAGDVLLNGQNTKTTKSSALAKTVGYLFQNPDRQICQNTIKGEIMFGLSYLLSDKSEREKRCKDIIQQFGFDPEQDPFNLSRGERQRVALASILVCEPELLILDEPTTGLDYRECMQIMNIIEELNQRGTTILMITHDMEIVHDYAEKMLVLSNGKLIGYDTCKMIMANQEMLRKASVLPAQIPALAAELGEAFSGVDNVTEMVERIHELKKRRA
ncbi:MAG TPA: ABC transporter ATP-binding protein [Lachnospiraceae bacterium]|jgi:energy-coupling factor transport system ATP-binding protein|nr:ABC transporter ATP-binding protein [Lachnospiraceae bacterium]